MLTTIEGTYLNGKVVLGEMPPNLHTSRVIVTFLPGIENKIPQGQMRFGQFSGDVLPTEEDFKIAEWQHL